jgi:hypothetical protein
MATPYYLAFTDEAQSISVLYTTTVTPPVIDEEGKEISPEVITVTPNYANISVLGTVYEPAPIPTPEDYEPVPYPAPNYGVNVLVIEDEDATPLEPYAVMPSPFPQRIWAE